jgi:hypothetical protein
MTQLSETGESRIRGYLYVLERSMRAAVSVQLARDAVREVESHIRERVAESDGTPNERDALEAILTRLGSPGTVARAYSLELLMEEATVSGRILPVMRSLLHSAGTGALSFIIAVTLFCGYTVAAAFIAVAALKPVFPQNVGLWLEDGMPRSFGAQFPAPTGMEPAGGYWVIPIALMIGVTVLMVVHRSARAWIASVRARLSPRMP